MVIGQGVHELWSDIQTNKLTNKQRFILYTWIKIQFRNLELWQVNKKIKMQSQIDVIAYIRTCRAGHRLLNKGKFWERMNFFVKKGIVRNGSFWEMKKMIVFKKRAKKQKTNDWKLFRWSWSFISDFVLFLLN